MAFRPKGTNRPSRSYDELCDDCKALKDENKKLKAEVKRLKTLLFDTPPDIIKFPKKTPPRAG